MKVCWNAIVRNESARIERCMKSLLGHIDSYVVMDTGSNDDTPKIIKDFFEQHNIPGVIRLGEFVTWEQARNDALACARLEQKALGWDYLMLVDADMELVVEDKEWRAELAGGASYDATQKSGTLAYANRRFIHKAADGWYIGVTHEYLDIPSAGAVKGLWFSDHADGANRPDKFARDIRLLKAALKDEKCGQRGRYLFYLGNSYRDAGKPENAIKAYKARVALGGWEEETWNAQVNLAEAYRDAGDIPHYIEAALAAYDMRPTRAEPLYSVSKYFREKGRNAACTLFADRAMNIPKPDSDMLFVNEFAHTAGPREDFAVCGFYVPSLRQRAFEVSDRLMLDPRAPDSSRAMAKSNMYYYVPKLEGPTHHKIEFTAPEGYTAMNPSIVRFKGQEGFLCAIRCVNYTIDNEGRYLIRNTETGEITNDNPIHTRTFIVELDEEFRITNTPPELQYDLGEPQFPLVRGLEDVRLNVRFEGDEPKLFGSACVRELHPEGQCEQARFAIANDGTVDKIHLMPTPHHEKNWAPLSGTEWFLYRIGHALHPDGDKVQCETPNYDVGETSGGSQLIPWDGGWLGCFHEARYAPNGKRYYVHRFVQLDTLMRPIRRSLPFVFQDRQIEFAMGMARRTRLGDDEVVISYGVRDCEPWLAVIDSGTLGAMLKPC